MVIRSSRAGLSTSAWFIKADMLMSAIDPTFGMLGDVYIPALRWDLFKTIMCYTPLTVLVGIRIGDIQCVA